MNRIKCFIENSIFVLFFVLMILNACDPGDSRLHLDNKTKKEIFVEGIFIKNNKEAKRQFGPQEVLPDTIQIVSITLENLEGIFNYGVKYYNDSTLDIVIYDKPVVYYTADSRFANRDKSLIQQLQETGNYKIRSYTYDELKKKNWLIVYPDDGFEQGRPLNPEK